MNTPATPIDPAQLISTLEAAQRLGIHPKTLRKMATEKKGKKPRVHAIKFTARYWMWHWPTLQKDLELVVDSAAA
jgi:hypothetical protein